MARSRQKRPSNQTSRQRHRASSDKADTCGPSPQALASGHDSRTSHWHVPLLMCGFLAVAVALVFGQTVRHAFVNYDDDQYVYENAHVAKGLNAQSIEWAFTTTHSANWHPLTWLSHMLDCQMYGLNAGGHHLTNVDLHAAVAILLLLVLWRMTRKLWPSVFVAVVFAIHPLRVESVAWVSERKDILSGLWFMLTLAAYVSYARRPFSLARYSAVVVLFAAGLMTKPMLVTLPFVLLLLDYWPLGRLSRKDGVRTNIRDGNTETVSAAGPTANRTSLLRRPLVEKIPLMALAAASCMATLIAQREAVVSLDSIPFVARIGNAIVACVAYMGELFWPAGLAVFYPHPGSDLPIWKVVVAVLILTGITMAAVVWRRRCPYVLVGWLWYLGMLVPVIGLVQVGRQSMADRYTYLPQIGLCIAIAWGVTELIAASPYRRSVCAVLSVLVVVGLMGCAWHDAAYWRDGESLWRRALECTSSNAVAHYGLGVALQRSGQADEAMAEYRKALEIKPGYAEAANNLALLLQQCGRYQDAKAYYQQALAAEPNYADVHVNFGGLLTHLGEIDEAIVQYKQGIAANPNCASVQQPGLRPGRSRAGRSGHPRTANRSGNRARLCRGALQSRTNAGWPRRGRGSNCRISTSAG